MLPDTKNIEEIYELVAKFEENKFSRTKTFNIEEVLNGDDETSSILGIGKLGVLRLNTYKIQTNVSPTNMISGTIDGLAALQQSIYFMLSIESDQYIIYPYTYGLQTIDLYGKASDYIMAILPERITNTLLSDDRITGVSDFEFEVNGRNLNVKFIVHSIYGDIDEETVVTF
jgi:hypothetical protein